jgi:hypothetical protein
LATESQHSRSGIEVASFAVPADTPRRPGAIQPQGFLTIRAGGQLDGAVTVATIGGGRGRSIVIVSWLGDGRPRWHTIEVASFERGLAVARRFADELAAGRPPRGRAETIAPWHISGFRAASRGLACRAGLPRVTAARRSLRCAEGRKRGGTA